MKRENENCEIEKRKKIKIDEQLNDEDAALYDRQIRLWGLDAQKRLRNSSILIVGGKALSNEICKNLVLAGVGSISIIDNEKITSVDLGSQFLISEKDIGKNRAFTMKNRLSKLNPSIKIYALSDKIEDMDSNFYNSYDVVCVTGKSLNTMIKINKMCRENEIKFYSSDVHGIFGYIFCDLINHKYIEEKKIKYGDDVKVKSYEKNESYTTLKNSINFKWPKMSLRRFLRKYSPIYFLIYILLIYQKENGSFPEYNESEDIENSTSMKKLQKIRNDFFENNNIHNSIIDDSLLKMIIRNAGMEILPICSIVGGILAQDILKVLSGKELPINNWFCYNGMNGAGIIQKLI